MNQKLYAMYKNANLCQEKHTSTFPQANCGKQNPRAKRYQIYEHQRKEANMTVAQGMMTQSPQPQLGDGRTDVEASLHKPRNSQTETAGATI